MSLVLGALRRLLGARASGFHRALSRPQEAQEAVAERIGKHLRRTEFGKTHGVGSGASFSAHVPVRTWEELEPWIARQQGGERGVLSAERLLFVEPTSGSSGPSKLVPYTSSLRSAFTHMFVVWVHDLLAHGPGLEGGRCYFSISPQLGTSPAEAARGIRDDRDYLDGWLRPLVAPFVAMPVGANEQLAPDVFWDRLARGLLATPDLEAISIWNPSFLTILLDRIEADPGRYARDLSAPRGAALRSADWRAVWPDLKLLSCWGDAEAAPLAGALRSRLPGVLVQPKGLLATEAPVTVPLMGSPGGVPLLDTLLVELRDDSGGLHRLHEAEDGGVYEVVISVPGGLVRYAIGDRVEVVGWRGPTPCLRFVGRTGGVCDLVGEKLNPDVAGRALEEAVAGHAFRTLVPLHTPGPHYALLLQGRAEPGIADVLDGALQRAYHYRRSRLLGQLGPIEVISSPELPEALVASQTGARLGDVKQRVLHVRPGDAWLARFRS